MLIIQLLNETEYLQTHLIKASFNLITKVDLRAYFVLVILTLLTRDRRRIRETFNSILTIMLDFQQRTYKEIWMIIIVQGSRILSKLNIFVQIHAFKNLKA